MSDAGKWGWGTALVIVAIVGLFLAARAEDTPIYLHGLLIFAFGAAAAFWLIARDGRGRGRPAAARPATTTRWCAPA